MGTKDCETLVLGLFHLNIGLLQPELRPALYVKEYPVGLLLGGCGPVELR